MRTSEKQLNTNDRMKRLCLMICLILTAVVSSGQSKDDGTRRRIFSPEDFRRKMEAFVSRDAGLTPYEAQQFFPLLHEMMDKQRVINDEMRDIMRDENKNTTENEYCRKIERVTELEIENRKVERTYYKKFHTVLSWKKIHAVRLSLMRFNMEALKRFSPPPQRFFDKKRQQ